MANLALGTHGARERRAGRVPVVALAVAAFALHLAEEALTGMHDDPLIVFAYENLAPLGARHAAYLVFQATLFLGLVATLLVASGARGRRIVLSLFAIALVAEAHHPLRALVTGAGNSGLATSLALPLLGAWLLRELTRHSALGTGPRPS